LSATDKQQDLELRVTPGVTVAGRSGSLVGSLHLAWENSVYMHTSDLNRSTLYANGSGTLDLYERRLFLDGSVDMSRQRSSIFGTSPSTGLYDPNSQTMLRTYSLSPYYVIQAPGDIRGEARYRVTYSNSSDNIVNNNLRHDVSFSLGNSLNPMPFGWDFSAAYSVTDYQSGQNASISSGRFTGLYAIDPLFRLKGIGGYERNDFFSSSERNKIIYGGGFDWTPSPRTHAYGQTERRFFGNGYDYGLSWRAARSGITGRLVRDVTTTSSTVDANGLQNLYLAYLLSVSNTSNLADLLTKMTPEQKSQADAAWNARGLPSPVAGQAYISQAFFLERRAELAGSWNGARNSFALNIYRSERERLTDPAMLAPGDDLASFEKTRDTGGGLYATHALSPLTNLSLGLSLTRSLGLGGIYADQETRYKNISLAANTSLGVRTIGGLIYQYNTSRGVSSFIENSLTANIGMRF